mmetsp:Transcript_52110/g.93395  ORF Transcript_52110/g.93395 Transcript_52110/m.93395 type:complete len:119 (+) Transcript_52110:82-438(+)
MAFHQPLSRLREMRQMPVAQRDSLPMDGRSMVMMQFAFALLFGAVVLRLMTSAGLVTRSPAIAGGEGGVYSLPEALADGCQLLSVLVGAGLCQQRQQEQRGAAPDARPKLSLNLLMLW